MKIIIFGYGYMGKIRHRVLSSHPDVEQVKIYDPHLAPGDANLNGLLLPTNKPIPWKDFDAAFVCTPNDITADLAIQAVQNCKNVFCEKPPGRNFADFQRIEAAVNKESENRIVFGFNHRLHPSVLMAKSMLGEGGLGRILFMKGTYGKSGGKDYKKSWRNDPIKSGGGILLDQGIHMLDILNTFLGPLNLKDAVLKDTFWNCQIEDNAFVLFESESGIPAFLHSSATLWKHTFSFEIGCEFGYLLVNGFLSRTGSYGREQLTIGRRQFEDEAFAVGNPREEVIHFDRDESWEMEVDEFIKSVKEGRSPTHGTLEQAGQVMKLINDVYVRTGMLVGKEKVQ